MTNESERNNTLFVFVGEKISVVPIPQKRGDFDLGVKAKYKVLQRVYGSYDKDIIDFIAYSHYGMPSFSKYKNVLLFLSEEEGNYYQEKYMYNDVYKTKDGRWAGSYPDDYAHRLNKKTTVKPEIIEFAEEVSYPINVTGEDGEDMIHFYPKPYFKTTGNKAIAVYGNYIEELFKLKKDGVLSARGLFGNPDLLPPLPEVRFAPFELLKVKKKDSVQLIKTWFKLYTAIKLRDTRSIKKVSLSNVKCSVCEGIENKFFKNNIESIDSFVIAAYRNFPNSQLWEKMKSKTFKISVIKFPEEKPENFQPDNGGSLIIYKIYFETITQFKHSKMQQSHEFQFVKTHERFKFYGMDSN